MNGLKRQLETAAEGVCSLLHQPGLPARRVFSRVCDGNPESKATAAAKAAQDHLKPPSCHCGSPRDSAGAPELQSVDSKA